MTADTIDVAGKTDTDATSFERVVEFRPAFDRPDAGIHGVEMRWYLKGPLGAIQFVVYTKWFLPHTQDHMDRQAVEVARTGQTQGRHGMIHSEPADFLRLFYRPDGVDIGYHSRTPRFEGQSLMQPDCPVIGGPCYYDGSSLAADRVLKLLIESGSDAVWRDMESLYREWLEESPGASEASEPTI